MADVTANTTFTRTVMGDRVVVYADIPGGGSTQDLIVVPHIIGAKFASACFRGSTVGSSSAPVCTVDGTTVSINQLAATTAASYTVRIEGRK